MGKGRAPCCDKTQVKKGPWSPAEDLRLIAFIQRNGHENWRSLPKQAGLARCGKSCRLRWINYLRPDVKRGNFTPDEEDTIMRLHESMGNKWARIASYLPGRTDNEIKNVWNTHLKRRVDMMEKMKKGGHESISKDVSTITSSSPTSSSTSSSCNNKSDNGKRKIDEVLVEEQSAGATKKPNCEENNKNVTVLVPTMEDTTIATTTSSLTYESNGKTCDGVLVQNMIKKTASSEEVNKPFGVDNNMVDTPNLEADFDFWSMLDMENLGSCNFQSNDSSCNYQVVQEHVGADHEACKNLSFVGDCDKVAEQKRWLKNLETELGLMEATKEQQNQINIDMTMMCGDDHDEFLMMKPAEDDVLGNLGCSRFWPSSPHSSNYII